MKGTSRFAMRRRFIGLFAAAAALAGAHAEARAEGLSAAYAITLAGLSVGDASLTLASTPATYRARLAMRLSGIAGLLTGARGAAEAAGSIVGARPTPVSYAITTTNGHAVRTVRMALQGGTVAALEVKPPVDVFDDRVPVTQANKIDVLDPISALVMPAPRREKPLDPSGCDRKLAVFDGVARFDVTLSYARMSSTAFTGYSGPTLVCSARYTPIAGHRASLRATSYMAENRDMEVTLAPIGGTQLLVPVKISVRTLFGMLEIDAVNARPRGENAQARTLGAQAGAEK
jgi:Protein of unknown function (DUF3108)